MVCMVYTFAIIGMEAFGGEESTVYPGCWWVALHIERQVFAVYYMLPKHCHSVNASFGVGSYFSANNSSVASPDVFWLNNFQTLYSSFGI